MEIEKQTQELLDAGLVEEFVGKDFPTHCSPVFLVDKKDTKTKRMVGNYVKMNRATKPHAAFIPDIHACVEGLAKCRFKSKMDMRSGFWQVQLTPQAQALSAFIIPSGRVFKWKRMPFGLCNAPGVFQELMEKAGEQCKRLPKAQPILKNDGHLKSFFDDTGLGTQTEDEHLALLELWFTICRKNNLRIKLSKCDFMSETIEYLGFEIGW